MGDLGHTAGRRRHTIPAPPSPPRLLWTAAPSARPQYLSPISVNVRVGSGPLPVSPPVPPLLAVDSVSKPPSEPPGDRPSGLPYGTPLGPWVLQRGVLWWHRTPSSFQGPSELGLEGIIPPILLEGGWTLSPVLTPPVPWAEPARRSPAAPYPPGRRCCRWPRQPVARMPTPVGVTSTVRHMQTAGACGKPLRGFPQTLPTPLFFRPATSSLPTYPL